MPAISLPELESNTQMILLPSSLFASPPVKSFIEQGNASTMIDRELHFGIAAFRGEDSSTAVAELYLFLNSGVLRIITVYFDLERRFV